MGETILAAENGVNRSPGGAGRGPSSARIAAAAVLLLTAASAWWLRPAQGYVTNRNGEPIAGASVRYQGACAAVLADARGRFEPLPNTGKARRITAWRDGFAIGWAPAGSDPLTIRLLPLPNQDNEDYVWLDPAPDPRQALNCGNCHETIYREWSASAHGRAANNAGFLAQYNRLAGDRPDDIGVCAKCHAPTLRDPTLDYDLRKVDGVDRHGVHCDFCHKIVAAPTDKLGTRFGIDGYSLLRPSGTKQLFFGPLDDCVRQGEAFGYLPLFRQSDYCASCHEGVIYGVHVYGTYSEWLASPARRDGKGCQDCHMAPTGKMTNIAPGHGGIERDPRSLASHGMPGGTLEMLRRCLSIQGSVEGRRVAIEILASNVGHRVPSGFIDRNLVLVVDAVDAAGQPLPLARGNILPPAALAFAGKPGKIYAKQLIAKEAALPLPFWQAYDDMVDTRLEPGQRDRVEFHFAQPVATARVRLVYRRFWSEPDTMVADRLLR